MERTIHLDGRPHPPDEAAHSWQGFSTGVWEGNMLTVTTTHLKENYLRRNGIPRSDQATATEHWIRHSDYLTVVTVIEEALHRADQPVHMLMEIPSRVDLRSIAEREILQGVR